MQYDVTTNALCFDVAVHTPSPGEKVAHQIYLKNKDQMNLMSRKRNAGVAPKFYTALVPIPVFNMGGGTTIGN